MLPTGAEHHQFCEGKELNTGKRRERVRQESTSATIVRLGKDNFCSNSVLTGDCRQENKFEILVTLKGNEAPGNSLYARVMCCLILTSIKPRVTLVYPNVTLFYPEGNRNGLDSPMPNSKGFVLFPGVSKLFCEEPNSEHSRLSGPYG